MLFFLTELVMGVFRNFLACQRFLSSVSLLCQKDKVMAYLAYGVTTIAESNLLIKDFLFLKIYFFIWFMYIMYIQMLIVVQRRCQICWNWNKIRVLETEPRSSGRTVYSWNCRTISTAPIFYLSVLNIIFMLDFSTKIYMGIRSR